MNSARIVSTLILVLAIAAVMFLLCACSSPATDETWTHLGPPDGADTAQKFDADGNPNFGPR